MEEDEDTQKITLSLGAFFYLGSFFLPNLIRYKEFIYLFQFNEVKTCN